LYGLEVWGTIRNLNDKRRSNSKTVKETGLSRNTVSSMPRSTGIQYRKKRKRGSKLDPYKERIMALFDNHNL
jgi:hypothetical protein